jgi:hypothetical protein
VKEDFSFYISDKVHYVKAKFKDKDSKDEFYKKESHKIFQPFHKIRGSIVKIKNFTIQPPKTPKDEYMFIISEMEFMGNKGYPEIGNPISVTQQLSKISNIPANPFRIKECLISPSQESTLKCIPGFVVENEEIDCFSSPEIIASPIPKSHGDEFYMDHLYHDSAFDDLDTQLDLPKEKSQEIEEKTKEIHHPEITAFQDFSISDSFPVPTSIPSSHEKDDFFVSNLNEDSEFDDLDTQMSQKKLESFEQNDNKSIPPSDSWRKRERLDDDAMLNLLVDGPIQTQENGSPILYPNDYDSDETNASQDERFLSQGTDTCTSGSSLDFSPPIEFNAKNTFHPISKFQINESIEDFLTIQSQPTKNIPKEEILTPDDDDVLEIVPETPSIDKKRKIRPKGESPPKKKKEIPFKLEIVDEKPPEVVPMKKNSNLWEKLVNKNKNLNSHK